MEEAVLFNSGTHERDVGDDGENNRHSHHRGRCNIHPGDNSLDIHKKNTEENNTDKGSPATASALTQHRDGNTIANKLGCHFEEDLSPPRHELDAARTEPENQAQCNSSDHAHQCQPVELEERTLTKKCIGEEIMDTGSVRRLRNSRNTCCGSNQRDNTNENLVPQRHSVAALCGLLFAENCRFHVLHFLTRVNPTQSSLANRGSITYPCEFCPCVNDDG